MTIVPPTDLDPHQQVLGKAAEDLVDHTLETLEAHGLKTVDDFMSVYVTAGAHVLATSNLADEHLDGECRSMGQAVAATTRAIRAELSKNTET
ncbi:hypothetical protein [Nitrospirillum viridazoti]|uniref:Uncharacterized protein n=1 Tax=Nitrospirillum amazonense TaxID=28077 RepID=A0A560INH3_9PROT|nr:hypothetical protein [Nitrospirillum amazonense]TWB58704.1 hypothetical protein FBZ92_109197 [Nitrospirillum amazonense]